MTAYRAGLVLLGLLSLGDLATPALTDGETPPMDVAVGVGLLGLASLVLVVLAWRRPARAAWVRARGVLRVVSALAAVPAFLVDDVPVAARVAAAVGVLLTVAGVVLVARRPAAVTA